MLDVVKFTWRNTHGYWIPVSWVLVLTETDVSGARSYAKLGRPGMTDFRVLDRATIPEELRKTGASQRLMSQVVLYDKNADEYTAQGMIDAMVAATA